MQQNSMVVRWGARYIAEKLEVLVNLIRFFSQKERKIYLDNKKYARYFCKKCFFKNHEIDIDKHYGSEYVRIFFPNHSSHSAKSKRFQRL